MAWNDGFCFAIGPVCGIDEMPDDISMCEKRRQIDEDAAYTQARDDRAGFNDWGDDDE